jgi:hypothetical protein
MELNYYKCKDCGCRISEEEYEDNGGYCDYCFNERNYLKSMKGIYCYLRKETFEDVLEQSLGSLKKLLYSKKYKKRVVISYEDHK